MDFIDQLRLLSSRIATTRSMVQTEEATKTAMIMPLIQALGYNVFDPTEVTPELIADIGTKKGEKVDYAILRDGQPVMLFECKKAGAELSINNAGQLFRYFHVTAARFGVLTNGLTYRFFTDLEQPNKMDETPFFEFNILDFKDRDVEELKKFAKSAFDVETILTTANELKYTRAIQNKLAELMSAPSEDFVRLVASEMVGGRRLTPAIRDQFTGVTKRAFEQLLAEKINERLKGAMAPEPPRIEPQTTPDISRQRQRSDGFRLLSNEPRGDGRVLYGPRNCPVVGPFQASCDEGCSELLRYPLG
jgi:predicted type IV restriction endonuclease